MNVIIYGKPNCPNCEKTKMLCQIQSIKYSHLQLGVDYEVEQLNELVGSEVRSLPQIFIQDERKTRYIGDYNALRSALAELATA